MLRYVISAFFVIILFLTLTVFVPSAAVAQPSGSVTGNVVNAASGATVAGAKVQLIGLGVSKTTVSGKDGTFRFDDVSAGSYVIRASAEQYQAYSTTPLPIAASQNFQLTIYPSPVTTTSISTIGHITVHGRASLNLSSAPVTTISSAEYVSKGLYQVQSALDTVPGVTIEHFDNGAPGNVATLTIRGAGGFVGGSNTGYEVLVLQDGEPLRNGQFGDFDLSTLTPAIYSRVEVVKGVGGTSLFGANTIGGTVNLVTRDPLQQPGGELIYSVGNFGTQDINLSGTSTFGKVGFLFDLHQFSTDGYIPSTFRADYGAFAPGTVGVITNPTLYFDLKSVLGKLKYSFSNSTNVVFTVTDESDIRDQTGLLGNPSPVCFSGPGCTNDPFGNPYFFGFPGNYLWNIQPKYAVDVHTTVGGGALVLRAYHQVLFRLVDGENAATPPSGCCFIQPQYDRLSGQELLWTREIGNNNSLTVGAGGNGDYFNYGQGFSSTFLPSTQIIFSNANCQSQGWCQGTQIERTYLVRDDADISPKLNVTFAGYYSSYDTLNVKRFDPRLAIVDKASNNTVFRASVGTGFAAPRISDLFPFINTSHFSAIAFGACPSSEPFCAASAGGNPNLKSETASGYDVGFEHLFGNGGDINVDYYRTNLKDHIFSGFEPAPPGTPTFDNGNPILFLEHQVNLAGTVYTGLETNLTIPISDNFSFDPYYNVQSAYPTDVPLSVEQVIGDIVNNQQYLGVPLHKAGAYLNYHTRSRTTTASFGGDWYAINNSYNTWPFWVYNASASIPVGDSSLHIGWTNIFNRQAGLFSNFNGGVQYQGAPGCNLSGNGVCNANDLYSTTMYQRAPHMLIVTFDRRWGSLR